ncbi:MAG: 50S ribosome-binding GTPase [Candidatus Bathyarchaeota archaeon]|nr:MAG: 50S ribosome-binding GTPase [Candidatus Bathyarchaeota archaeon]
MPTNLPAEAKKKWNEAFLARNPRKKLQCLQEFLSLVPKHKGTEKLRAQVKTKIATLRREIQDKKRRKGKVHRKFFIEKEGASQIVILGQTNTGRSSLLAAMTNANVEISDYAFTTREPVPGMLPFEDLQFQIIEAPALIEGASEGKAWGQQTLALARNADGLILLVDLSKDPCHQLNLLLDELEKARILTRKPNASVEINRTHIGVGLRILVMGSLVGCTLRDVERLLKSYKIRNAVVKLNGRATLDDVEDSIFESSVFRPAIIVASKLDVKRAPERLKELESCVNDRFKIVAVPSIDKSGGEQLGEELFKSLGIIRVYTKQPNRKESSPDPFIIRKNSTVAELAQQIHSDFARRSSYARVWSKRLPFSPRKVGLSFVLADKDVVEMHVR